MVTSPSRSQALRFWAWLGWVSFGGPAAQIALMHSELVERRRWVDEARFQHALSYCMVLPGPEAQQLATYLGWLLHGRAMGIAAGLLFILPAWILMLGLGGLYMTQGQQPWLQGVLAGLKPAVLALVVWALWRMGRKSLQHRLWLLVALEALVLLRLGLPFPVILLLAAALGAVAARRGWGELPTAVAADVPRGPAPQGTAPVLGLGLLFWAMPMGLLLAWQGLHGFFPQLAGFFTQAALLTFGGAYAVLPFVAQAVVQQQGWITAAQLMDGLALGETTPGPLVIVLVFIGFVAGWQRAGADPLAWGLLGGAVAGFFTFLPSFVFILVGAPWVERSRQLPALAGPLARHQCGGGGGDGGPGPVSGPAHAQAPGPLGCRGAGACVVLRSGLVALAAAGGLGWWRAPPWWGRRCADRPAEVQDSVAPAASSRLLRRSKRQVVGPYQAGICVAA